MKPNLLRTLVGMNIEHFKVRGRKNEQQIHTGTADQIKKLVDIALSDNNQLRLIMLFEIYEFYKNEPFYKQIFKPLFERLIFEKGATSTFTQFSNHILTGLEDYDAILKGAWITYPGKRKPDALIEAFHLYFKRCPENISKFKGVFTITDRTLLNLD
jgi:hypothetical protein